VFEDPETIMCGSKRKFQIELVSMGVNEAALLHQNLQEPKIEEQFFSAQILCLVSDTCSPRSSTGIATIKYFSILGIRLIFLLFIRENQEELATPLTERA
jgi:hypothetical protein